MADGGYLECRCDAVTTMTQSTKYRQICDELLTPVDTNAGEVHECSEIDEHRSEQLIFLLCHFLLATFAN